MYSGMLLGHRKKEVLPFVTTGLDLEEVVPSELRQYGVTYRWRLPGAGAGAGRCWSEGTDVP